MSYYRGKEFDYQDPRWKGFENEFPKIRMFLNNIHGRNPSHCMWKAIDKGKQKRQAFNYGAGSTFNWVKEKIFIHNKTGYEIFFSISPYECYKFKKVKGKKKRLKQWRLLLKRCFVIDIDCGPEENVKREALLNIDSTCQQYGIPYTHLVKSRNGFQVYWTISGEIENDIWIAGQRRLISLFKSDPAIVNILQDMRIPCMYHWKGNSEGYFVDIEFKEAVPRYQLEKFREAIGLDETMVELLNPSLVPVVPKIKLRKPETFLKGQYHLHDEVGEILENSRKDQELLRSYLNIREDRSARIHCPFHQDNIPSSAILLHSNGHYIFVCKSSKCGKSGDFVEMVKQKENISGKELVNRVLELCDDFGLNEKSIRLRNYFEYLDKNLESINNNPPIIFSNYTKADKPLIEYLIKIHEFAKSKIINNDLKFPGSLSEIQKYMGISTVHRSTKKLYFLVFMGLIQRLKESDIPSKCLEENKRYSQEKGYRNNISWWHIPEYTDEILKEAFGRLKELRLHRINLANINQERILKAFGKDTLDRVFVGSSTFNRVLEVAKESEFESRGAA